MRLCKAFCMLCLDIEQVEIEHGGGDGQQGRVEAVEHSAVAGKDVAAILDAELALEEAFHQVAPGAEYADRKAETKPVEEGHLLWEEMPKDYCCCQAKQSTADASYP